MTAAAFSTRGEIRGLQAKFIDAGGLRTRYYDVGSGEPIVLCHGAGWSGYFNANLWDLNIGGLSRDFRVVAADKIGSGMTDNPARPDDYTIQAQVAHMSAFIEALGLRGIHLVGQSRGAYLAARIALEQPGLARTLTLVNSTTLAPGDSSQRRAALFAGKPDRVNEAVLFTLRQLSFDPAHISNELLEADLYMDNLPKARETLRHWTAGGEALFNRTLAAQKKETLEWITAGRLSMPVLLVWGRDDRFAILPQGLDLLDLLCAHNPSTRMYIMNQAGHFPFREHPDEFNRVLRTFITP